MIGDEVLVAVRGKQLKGNVVLEDPACRLVRIGAPDKGGISE
jgi:hypothetical protein